MASTNAIQGPPSNLTNTIDGITNQYSNGQLITGNYLNSMADTLGVNTSIYLDSGGTFIVRDTSGNAMIQITDPIGTTVFARPQTARSPTANNDLVNFAYITSLISAYITTFGSTTILNKTFKLSPGSDSFTITDNSNNVLFSVNSSGSITLLTHGQTAFTPAVSNDLVNLGYLTSSISNFVPYTGATANVDLNTRNFTTQYNKIDNANIGCGVITTSAATVGGTQNIFWRPNFVGPYYGWILSSEASLNPGVDLNIRIPYIYSDYVQVNGPITSTGLITGSKGLFNNGNAGPPSVGTNGGNGDRLILYPGGVSEMPFSLGIDSFTLWLSAGGNNVTSEDVQKILFYSGQRARWRMNGTSTTANFTSQQSYMNISDQSGNKLVSSASSLMLSTTSNGPIIFSVDNGTSNHFIVSDTFSTCDDLNVRGTFGGVSGAIIRLGNATSLSSGYDAIQFVRSNSNPVLFCDQNYIVPITSGTGSFVGDSAVGDMVLRTASTAIRMTVNSGGASQFVLDTYFKIGGTSNTKIESSAGILSLLINNVNASVISASNTSFYDAGTPMAYIGYVASQDQLAFLRYATTNPCILWDTQQIGYASVAGAFIVNSVIGDICVRLNQKAFRVSSDNGSTSSLVVSPTTNNVGVNMGTALAKFHVNQSFVSSGDPENIPDWNSTYSCFSNSTGSRNAGFGIGFNSNATSASTYLLSVCPNISWNPMYFSAASFFFRTNASSTFNISYLGTGALYSNGGTLTNTNPSDRRLKHTITPLENNLDIINKLRPVIFLWNDQQKHGSKLQIGFIAQEVQEVLPVIVSEYTTPIIGPSNKVDSKGMRIEEVETNLGVDTMALIPIVIGSVKELHSQINKQQETINEQQKTIDLLLQHMATLTAQVNLLTQNTRKNSIKKQ